MKMKPILSLLVTAGLILSTACGTKPAAEGTVRFVLDWTPNTNHTGVYVAQELGYYREAGLEVEIQQPPEDGALALVAAGKAEFCVDFQESLGLALTADTPLPVEAVAALISHNTSGIVSLKEGGIRSPKDLEGKRMAAWGIPLVNTIMRTVVEADGGDFAQVDMLPGSVTDVVSALQSDIDAMWVYYGWEGIAAEVAGLDINYQYFSDLDPTFDFYTPILVGSSSYLESHPEQARAFLAATEQGYRYAMEHPEEAAQILLKSAPELSEELVLNSQQYLATWYQSDDSPYWGYIDQQRWATFYDWLYAENLLERELSSGGFTNAYLSGYEVGQ